MAKKNVNEKKVSKENKQNKHYFRDMKAELKKVVWPTPKQLTNSTVAVIAFTLIIALIVFILDICFDGLNKYGIAVLQEKVQSAYSNNEDENSESNNEANSESDDELNNETETELTELDSENIEENEEVVNETTQNTETNE